MRLMRMTIVVIVVAVVAVDVVAASVVVVRVVIVAVPLFANSFVTSPLRQRPPFRFPIPMITPSYRHPYLTPLPPLPQVSAH